MQLYDATVRLNGKIQNEVPKRAVTAAEVLVLKKVHGADAVVGIKPVKDEPRSHEDERNRLGRYYGDKVVFELFGAEHQELPMRLAGISVDAPKRQRREKADAGEGEGVKSLLDD